MADKESMHAEELRRRGFTCMGPSQMRTEEMAARVSAQGFTPLRTDPFYMPLPGKNPRTYVMDDMAVYWVAEEIVDLSGAPFHFEKIEVPPDPDDEPPSVH